MKVDIGKDTDLGGKHRYLIDIPEKILERIDQVAEEAGTSRKHVTEQIVIQAVLDKSFLLKLG